MTDTDNSRLNRMAERLAVVESKLRQTEKALPRIGKLETGMASLKTSVESLGDDIKETKADCGKMITAMGGLSEQHIKINARISQLFWTGAGVMLLASALIGAVGLYQSWLDIQDKQQHLESHP
jgi:hypothetical protein